MPVSARSSRPTEVVLFHLVLRFWYQVLTWVSDRLSLAASSCLSWTLRYFCFSKVLSRVWSW